MNKVFFTLLIFYYQPAFPQARELSKEEFVNEIFSQVTDSSFSKYYLLNQAEPCSFKKFDYEQLLQYSLKKMVSIDVLNELAKNASAVFNESSWSQEKMDKAVCIDAKMTESVLDPTGDLKHNSSLTKREKRKAIKLAEKEWQKKPLEEKLVFCFSKPVFTDDYQYAVIDMISMNGPISSAGSTYFFKRAGSKWELIGKVFGWQN